VINAAPTLRFAPRVLVADVGLVVALSDNGTVASDSHGALETGLTQVLR